MQYEKYFLYPSGQFSFRSTRHSAGLASDHLLNIAINEL